MKLFLLGDAAACVKSGQKLLDGYSNLERMLRSFTTWGGEIGVCGPCMDARGLMDDELAEGVYRSTPDELTDRTVWADRVIAFRQGSRVHMPSRSQLGNVGRERVHGVALDRSVVPLPVIPGADLLAGANSGRGRTPA